MMMDRANSPEAYVPSMMPFVGLEGSSQKQQPWAWDSTTTLYHHPIATSIPVAASTTSLALQNHHPFFPTSSSLDFPPSVFPGNSFSFYSPPVVDYPAAAAEALVKREECGGATSAVAGAGKIELNLGHRTYFSSGDALAIDRLFARSRGVYSLSHQPPRCQAEGCNSDLSGAKHYHRRHKVCEFHSKAAVVIAGGLQQRFCQQCSRFHVLAEFDSAKRSCRKRLADHNRRRRKSQLPAGNADFSVPRNPTTNSMEKSKQISKAPRDDSTGKSTASICKTNANLVGQLEYSNKATPLRHGPDLSLGGVEPVKKGGKGSSNAMYQSQGQSVAMAEEKVSQQQQQLLLSFSSPTASGGTFFHHYSLFSSSSNEASPSPGEGSDHNTSHHHQHQNNLLHLGQAMFEVDFM